MPFLKSFKASSTVARINESKRNGLRRAIFGTSKVLKDKYTGEWKNDKKEGKGTKLSKNGWLYEGDWRNGCRHGYGVYSKVSKDGTIWKCYSGNWCDDKWEGFGGNWYPNGSYFEGTFKQNKRDGFGRMWYSNGDFYQGTWKDNLFHGEGMLVQANGNRYEGEFSCGMKQGRGVFYHLDNGQLQEGFWKEDVCTTSTVQDIYWRQSAVRPTRLVIPEVQLADKENVISRVDEAANRN